MTTHQVISVRILAAMASGMTVQQAVDAVLGVGSFEKIAGDLYEALRAKAGKGGAA
jgi:hypothetical protein